MSASHAHCTLTETELAACRPVAGKGSRALRAFCPFHGSDHQRSLRITLATGRFQCFACGAWGYLEAARQRWREARQHQTAFQRPAARPSRPDKAPQERPPIIPASAPPDPAAKGATAATRFALVQLVARFQAALPGSPGSAYLHQRGIPLALAGLSQNRSVSPLTS